MALSRIFHIAFAAITVLASTGIAAPSDAFSEVKRGLKFNFGVEKIRGVNLGGWLLLEVGFPNSQPILRFLLTVIST